MFSSSFIIFFLYFFHYFYNFLIKRIIIPRFIMQKD